MNSLILQTASRLLLPLLLLFAVFLLARGHHEPGGGFAGGLMAATGITLYVIAYDVPRAQRLLGWQPRTLIGSGLLLSAGSGMAGWAGGEPFLTGRWWIHSVPILGKLEMGTPLIFDAGVFLVVIGVTTLIIFPLFED